MKGGGGGKGVIRSWVDRGLMRMGECVGRGVIRVG